jgi:hypothetical protein
MGAQRSKTMKLTACAAVAGTVIAFTWMYMAAAAITYGVFFPDLVELGRLLVVSGD